MWRLPPLLVLLCVAVSGQPAVPGHPVKIEFAYIGPGTLEKRLRLAAPKVRDRLERLKALLEECGCGPAELVEQPVKGAKEPNLICTVPGPSPRKIVVGAHYDSAGGDGMIDNWSGAIVLPSLYEVLRNRKFRHTLEFVGFAAEEKGLLGSQAYVRAHQGERRKLIAAAIAIDSIGMGPVKVWPNSSDADLMTAAALVAHALRIGIAGVDPGNVGTTDSMSFKMEKIPVLSLHSLTQENFRTVNSKKDVWSAVSWSDYYDTYKFVSAMISYLDQTLPVEETGSTPGP